MSHKTEDLQRLLPQPLRCPKPHPPSRPHAVTSHTRNPHAHARLTMAEDLQHFLPYPTLPKPHAETRLTMAEDLQCFLP